MSKILPFVLAGLGSSAVSVGGTYLIKATSVGTPGPTAASEEPLSAVLTPTTKALFKSTGKDAPCVKKYFGELTFENTPTNTMLSDSNKLDSDYFSGNEASESCLVVNWERTNSSDTSNKKWHGNFRWLWTFRKGNKGFVMFTTTKKSDDANTLDLEGGVYVVEQENTSWSIKKHKEFESDNKIAKDSFDTSFPKAANTLPEMGSRELWDFMSSGDELEHVCKEGDGDCPTSAAADKAFKGSWTFTTPESTPLAIAGWSPNISQWLPGLYPKNEFDLEGSLQSVAGSWKKETVSFPNS